MPATFLENLTLKALAMQRLFLIFSRDKTRSRCPISFPLSTSTNTACLHWLHNFILSTMLCSHLQSLLGKSFMLIHHCFHGQQILLPIKFTVRSTHLLPRMILPTFKHQQMAVARIVLTLWPGRLLVDLVLLLSVRNTRLMHLFLGTSLSCPFWYEFLDNDIDGLKVCRVLPARYLRHYWVFITDSRSSKK